MQKKKVKLRRNTTDPFCNQKVKTGFFCCRNNGTRKNPIKRGSIEYAKKHGLFSHEYNTNDSKYRHPKKIKELQENLLRT